ncbi:MAG: hypothetical protein WA208_11025 [Thermoanaerobaculia bacterium]
MSDQEIMVKATPLQAVLDFMTANLKPEVKEKVFIKTAVEFPEETNRVRGQKLLAFDRVPLRFTIKLVELTAEEMHEQSADVAYRIGRLGAEAAAKGVLRLALTMISIPSLLRKLEPVWTQLYSHGKMSSTCEAKSAVVELKEFPLISATFCSRVTGWFAWFAEKAEKTATVKHVSCRTRGDATCRWSIAW